MGKWSSLGSDFPKGICAAVASGANHILLFQKEPEDTQHLKKENALWKYHTITQTLVKSECIPGTYDTMQVLQRNRSFVILGSNASSGTNRLYSLQGDIVPLEKGLGLVNILVIIGYFAVLAGIGIYFSRRQKSTNDYFKGGGRIPWWAAGLSLFGTALSAITFMLYPPSICHELELCVVQYRYCVCCPRYCLCLYSFFPEIEYNDCL